MNHPPGTPHRTQLYALIAARPRPVGVAHCRAAHRPIGPSTPLAQPCRIEYTTELGLSAFAVPLRSSI
eukprot:3968330-Prymnesium_polylepis.1